MPDTDAYRRYLAGQRRAVAMFDCLEINHSQWPFAVRITNLPGGCTTPDSLTWFYCPIAVKPPSLQRDMTVKTDVTLQDLNDSGDSNGLSATVRDLERLITNGELPTVRALGYLLMDDDTITGPVRETQPQVIEQLEFNEQGAVFSAQPRPSNEASTGIRATYELYPMMVQWTT